MPVSVSGRLLSVSQLLALRKWDLLWDMLGNVFDRLILYRNLQSCHATSNCKNRSKTNSIRIPAAVPSYLFASPKVKPHIIVPASPKASFTPVIFAAFL